jgi:hypothetical protein
MSEELQTKIESLRGMVETRDLLIADLEREIRELRAMLSGTWNDAIESALLKLPGGSYCDPQDAADDIRELKIALNGTPSEWDGEKAGK